MPKFPRRGPPRPPAANPFRQSGSNAKRNAAKPLAPDIVRLLEQGTTFQRRGDFGRAAACYGEILARHPNQPDALHLLGAVALAVGDVNRAVGLFERSLATKSSDPALHVNLANALLQKHDADNAEFHLRKALKLDPGNVSALSFLADCRSMAGDERAAKRMYEEVLARLPDHPQATFGYAHLLVTLGELETAGGLYRKALGWGTATPLALAGLAACEKIAPDSPEAAEIERSLRQPGLKAVEYLGLRFAAGQIADRAGRYDEAFEHFVEAKKLAGVHFDLEAQRKTFATIKSTFTPSFFAERRNHGNPSERPVFVVGMPRSGTTLTEQIISSHPQVAGAGELGDMTRIAVSLGYRRYGAGDFSKRVASLTRSEVRKLADRYLAVLEGISRLRRPRDRQDAGQLSVSRADRAPVSERQDRPLPPRSARHLHLLLHDPDQRTKSSLRRRSQSARGALP